MFHSTSFQIAGNFVKKKVRCDANYYPRVREQNKKARGFSEGDRSLCPTQFSFLFIINFRRYPVGKYLFDARESSMNLVP
jgi:hypothetical protein